LYKDLFSYDKSDWHIKTNIPNGIPDYIDEIAFALDSSWSMEIERFKFMEPIPVKGRFSNSSRYKIYARKFVGDDSGNFGFTYPKEQSSGPTGWSSIIHINTDWHSLGYDSNPKSALYVACAHEFFHAIQYAMTWNVVNKIELDDFPLSWLEGTATSMEELAFPSVNDYIGYSIYYFKNPTMSLLIDNGSDLANYANSLLMLYIYFFSQKNQDISFLRTATFNNYTKSLSFNQNLKITSKSLGTTWTELLNNFHTASFFTGKRSDTTKFINDATQFKEWSYTDDPPENSASIRKSISPYSMETFSRQRLLSVKDTLNIYLHNLSPLNFQIEKNWGASLILSRDSNDSIIPIFLDSAGEGSLEITQWTSFKKALVIITNGDPVQTRQYEVMFDDGGKVHNSFQQFAMFPNPASIRKNSVKFTCTEIDAIYIYTTAGSLIYKYFPSKITNEVIWNLKNNSNKTIAPGFYSAVIKYRDIDGGPLELTHRKLLIIP
jgi:hypothetical protein